MVELYTLRELFLSGKPTPFRLPIPIFNFGGGGEIRTHGALRHAAFQVRCVRPLCHPSLESVVPRWTIPCMYEVIECFYHAPTTNRLAMECVRARTRAARQRLVL